MNNLLYLNRDEFRLDRGDMGPVLCLNQKGVCFVLFHAYPRQCEYCDYAVPQFKKLPMMIGGAKFGLCNIQAKQNQDIVRMSAGTVSEIEGVPTMILFFNGRPFLRFEDEDMSAENMADFLNQVIARLQNHKKFVDKGFRFESEVPKYSVGVPFNIVCDEEKGVCYFSYEDAYKKHKYQQNFNPNDNNSQGQLTQYSAGYQAANYSNMPRGNQADLRNRFNH